MGIHLIPEAELWSQVPEEHLLVFPTLNGSQYGTIDSGLVPLSYCGWNVFLKVRNTQIKRSGSWNESPQNTGCLKNPFPLVAVFGFQYYYNKYTKLGTVYIKRWTWIFLQGHLKSVMYIPWPRTHSDLKKVVPGGCTKIRKEMVIWRTATKLTKVSKKSETYQHKSFTNPWKKV